ncbi:MAG: LLM class flavin-dependent oxidoreductase [Burkholderiales bacterium]
MRFGLFYEHQLPRPWTEGLEMKLFQDALDQVELADRLGFDNLWTVEHHFLEEYSHSSAPEAFLAACTQRTKQMRLGHGVVLTAPGYNHPARVAERVATLDLLSKGRIEFGFGESGSQAELDGYGIDRATKQKAAFESMEQCLNMLSMEPYPGFQGEFFSMPARNVVPKPIQRPHPPLWLACSNRESMKVAARLGCGALTFAFVEPTEAKQWVEEYYRVFREECIPIGHTVNPNVAMVSSFGLHQNLEEARSRFLEGFRFFGFSNAWHYQFGRHIPGRTNIWDRFQSELAAASEPGVGDRAAAAARAGEGGISTPQGLREHLRKFEAIGVDQVAFIQQSGRVKHEHICEELELFADEVMGEFKDREAERVKLKHENLAPYIDAAMKRKREMKPLADAEIAAILAPGRGIAEEAERKGEPVPYDLGPFLKREALRN